MRKCIGRSSKRLIYIRNVVMGALAIAFCASAADRSGFSVQLASEPVEAARSVYDCVVPAHMQQYFAWHEEQADAAGVDRLTAFVRVFANISDQLATDHAKCNSGSPDQSSL